MNVDDAWQLVGDFFPPSIAPPTTTCAEEEEAGRRLGDVDSRRRLRVGGCVVMMSVRMSRREVLAVQAQWSAKPAGQ